MKQEEDSTHCPPKRHDLPPSFSLKPLMPINAHEKTDDHMIVLSSASPIPPPVLSYLEDVVRTCVDRERGLVSVVLFGSAAIGGFSATVSDVDMILVVPDHTSREDKNQLR